MNKINRRDFIITGGATLGMSALAACGGRSVIDSEVGRVQGPNLLIIHTDQHNFRTLGCYRETLSPEQAFMWGETVVVETPNLDWLAHHGAICTKFYATTPVCSPSRASFVSGQYPQNTSVVSNNLPLHEDVITFAEILSRHGYATGYAGKWHLAGEGRPEWDPNNNFGFQDNRFMFNRGHGKQVEDGLRIKNDIDGADESTYTTDWLTNKTIEFIQHHQDRAFCYMVSIPDPHDPHTVRPPYNTMYSSMTFEKPRTYHRPPENTPSWAEPIEVDEAQDQYYGMVKCIDDNVGKILTYLEETSLLEKTIIVFTADHGDLRGEHHRLNKGVPLEASAKVPFIIYYPALIKAGTIVNQALGSVDFLPTILSLMDIQTARREEGRDASRLLTGNIAAQDWQDIMFVRGVGIKKWTHWLAAFTSQYKLIVSLFDSPWLIDMERDPDELINFCSDPEYQTIVQTLAQELMTYGRDFNDPRISVPKIAEDLRQLAQGRT